MIFSDCYGDIEPFVTRLKHLRARGNDVILFQIVAPEEVTFNLRGDGQLIDLERSSPTMEVDFARIRTAYQARFQRHMDELGEEVRKTGCDHVVMTTDQPMSDVLSAYLHRRSSLHGKGK